MHRRPAALLFCLLAALPAAAQSDIPSLEAKAKELYQKKAYTSPAGENVVDVCKQLILADPTNATAADLLNKVIGVLVTGGEKKLAKRDYSGAIGSFAEALALDPQNKKALAGRDKARTAQEKEKFEVEAGQPVEYYLTKGNELFEQKDYVRARKYYLAILKQIPDDPFAQRREKECNEMLAGAPSAAAGAPSTPEARIAYYREVAAQLEKSGQYDASLSYYRQILEQVPDDVAALEGAARSDDFVKKAGRIYLTPSGAPFFWQAKVKTAAEAQEELTITVSVVVDGKETASFQDTTIEQLNVGDVCKNELHLPPSFSARVPSPGQNQVSVQISAGSKKPRTFGGQITLPFTVGGAVKATLEGTSTLQFGGAFGKKMDGDYKIAIKAN